MLDAFDAPYMQRALVAALLLSIPLGLLGTWVVLRGLAFFAHAVGVATFPGLVIGTGVPAIGPFLGALAAAAAFSGSVSVLERDERVRGGAVTGLVLSAAMALGSVLLVSVFETSVPVEGVLFGSLLAVGELDVLRAALLAVVAAAALVALGPRLAAGTFDRSWAGPAGARTAVVDAALLALAALAVVVALPVIGSLLVSGMLVVPAATARLVSRGTGAMLAWSVALTALSLAGGLWIAHALDAPPGGAAAGLAGGLFAVAYAVDGARARRPAAEAAA
ncbi:MAG TPA: metal ABC transporter permease [Thermoleophilaceae bacterium]|jgi:ABC-type Mn2+/Zn2+ transport system permease subunit